PLVVMLGEGCSPSDLARQRRTAAPASGCPGSSATLPAMRVTAAFDSTISATVDTGADAAAVTGSGAGIGAGGGSRRAASQPARNKSPTIHHCLIGLPGMDLLTETCFPLGGKKALFSVTHCPS